MCDNERDPERVDEVSSGICGVSTSTRLVRNVAVGGCTVQLLSVLRRRKRREFGFYSCCLSSLLYHFSVRFSPSSLRIVVGLAHWRARQLIHADIKCYLKKSTSCGETAGFWCCDTTLPVERHRLIHQHSSEASTRGEKCDPRSDGSDESLRPTNICQSVVQQPRNLEN